MWARASWKGREQEHGDGDEGGAYYVVVVVVLSHGERGPGCMVAMTTATKVQSLSSSHSRAGKGQGEGERGPGPLDRKIISRPG